MFCGVLYSWLSLEFKAGKDSNQALRISVIFVFLFFCAFFCAGNSLSIGTFALESIVRFNIGSRHLVIASLILFKLIVPGIIVCFTYKIIVKGRNQIWQMQFMRIMILFQFMSLPFLGMLNYYYDEKALTGYLFFHLMTALSSFFVCVLANTTKPQETVII